MLGLLPTVLQPDEQRLHAVVPLSILGQVGVTQRPGEEAAISASSTSSANAAARRLPRSRISISSAAVCSSSHSAAV